MASTKEAKVKFTAETGEFNKAISEANSDLTELRSELKLNAAEMKGAGASVELLTQRQEILARESQASQQKISALTNKLETAKSVFGENSTEVKKLQTQLNNAKTAEVKIQQEISSTNSELQESKSKMGAAERAARDLAGGLDDAADSAKDMGSSVGDIALGNIIADGATSAISSVAGLEEATRQYRNEQAKLAAIAQTQGKDLGELKDSYSDIYAITADETLASTAVANMSAMGLSQENTNKLLTAATGIWAQYGDSIPLDGLMESVNETAKAGAVTGNLADALNWAGISEDEFNEKLADCSTEQERQQLIVDTLNGEYSELAGAYEENNKSVMDMNRSEEALLDAQSQLAESTAPLKTAFNELAAGGLKWVADNLPIIVPLVAGAGVAFAGLFLIMKGKAIIDAVTISIKAMNLAMKANPIGIIITIIAALVVAFIGLWKNCEGFRNFWINLWNKIKDTAGKAWDFIKNAFEKAKTTITNVFNKIKSVAVSVWNGVKNAIMNPVKTAWNLVSSVASKIKSVLSFSGFKSKVSGVFNGIKSAITKPIETARSVIKGIIDKIKGFFSFKVSLPKIKLPHFSIKPKGWELGDLLKGSIPSLGIEWYAKGGIMTKPTFFGTNGGKAMFGGEAGHEAVLPISTLMDYIDIAFQRNIFGYAGNGGTTNIYMDDIRVNDDEEIRSATKSYLELLARKGLM